MVTSTMSIILTLSAAFAGSLGPVFLKKASTDFSFSSLFSKKIFSNVYLFFGVFFYGIGTVLFIPALKGGDLSVLYPLLATTYIWVSLWSVFLLKEKMHMFKWGGVILILIGVSCIGAGV